MGGQATSRDSVMKICLVTNVVSPHLMPFAHAVVNLIGSDNFRYVATVSDYEERKALGWVDKSRPDWVLELGSDEAARLEAAYWSANADVVLSGLRDFTLFEQRAFAGRLTFYMSERWFKPPLNMTRLFHLKYLAMAIRICRLLALPSFYYLPIGVHAENDMKRLVKLLAGKMQLDRIRSKMLLWGYFVERSNSCEPRRYSPNKQIHLPDTTSSSRMTTNSDGASHGAYGHRMCVLWVGRMLKWKHVDTLIEATRVLNATGRAVTLKLVGYGPEEVALRKLAQQQPVVFMQPVPIDNVRGMMRDSDVYVLPSDGGEGWGAVVGEAMEERCAVIATRASGSGATLVKDGENGLLFEACDVEGLVRCLCQLYDDRAYCRRLADAGYETMRSGWCPEVAADRFLATCIALLREHANAAYDKGPLRIASSVCTLRI